VTNQRLSNPGRGKGNTSRSEIKGASQLKKENRREIEPVQTKGTFPTRKKKKKTGKTKEFQKCLVRWSIPPLTRTATQDYQ